MVETRMPGADRGPAVTFSIDGESIRAHRGETVAMALFAAGRAKLRHSARLGAPRGIFCNMGICYECLVYVLGDGATKTAVRSCMLLVEDGLRLSTWRPEAVSFGAFGDRDAAPGGDAS